MTGEGIALRASGSVISLAAAALREQTGLDVDLAWQRTMPGGVNRKALVMRCHVSGPDADQLAPTVIVKRSLSPAGRAYDPTSQDPANPSQWLINEWAALKFLEARTESPITPRCFAGDLDEGTLVIEDFGDGDRPDPLSALLGHDPQHATDALREAAITMGQLHAATIGARNAFLRTRRSLGRIAEPLPPFEDAWPATTVVPITDAERANACLAYRNQLKNLGIRLRPGIDAEINRIIEEVEGRPLHYDALCPGDQTAPIQVLRFAKRPPALIDFDRAGFRHALLESGDGRFTWRCAQALPDDVASEIEKAYRSTLSEKYTDATDDDFYGGGLLQAAARWHLHDVIALLPTALECDFDRGLSTLREQVLARLTACIFIAVRRPVGAASDLLQCAHDMHEILLRRWPNAVNPLPLYPAYR